MTEQFTYGWEVIQPERIDSPALMSARKARDEAIDNYTATCDEAEAAAHYYGSTPDLWIARVEAARVAMFEAEAKYHAERLADRMDKSSALACVSSDVSDSNNERI